MHAPSVDSLLGIFISSIIGSLHCVAMCGGFVSMISFARKQQNTKLKILDAQPFSQLSYNLGRLVAYLALGGFAGFMGQMLDKSVLEKINLNTAYITGTLIILWGLYALVQSLSSFQVNTLSKLQVSIANFSTKFLAPIHRNITKLPLSFAALILGLCSGLLPCGWLYIYVGTAASSASPAAGALIMFVFWLGTVPALLILAVFATKISARLKKVIPLISALVILSLGIFTLVGKFQHSHHDHGSHHQHHSH